MISVPGSADLHSLPRLVALPTEQASSTGLSAFDFHLVLFFLSQRAPQAAAKGSGQLSSQTLAAAPAARTFNSGSKMCPLSGSRPNVVSPT